MYKKYIKSALDTALSTVGLLILFIPFILVALAIKLDSKGPVFFKQLRYGKHKKPFLVYKFRTMRTDAPANIATNSFKNSTNYITAVGKILRKLSIDELPQIFNVLNGDMSLVGPRPVVLSEHNLIALREGHGANAVKPGITGWAQVNGRDELDDIIKARMDGQYVENFGLKTDIGCLFKTVWVILSAAGHNETQDNLDNIGNTELKGVSND